VEFRLKAAVEYGAVKINMHAVGALNVNVGAAALFTSMSVQATRSTGCLCFAIAQLSTRSASQMGYREKELLNLARFA
jgi:hypothetical protein